MGIEKFRRNVKIPGLRASATGSFAALDVASQANLQGVAIGGGLTGSAAFRGISTVVSGAATVVISATQVLSGVALPQVTLGQTTVASHRPRVFSVNSVVDGTSFIAVSDAALVDNQQIAWVIVG